MSRLHTAVPLLRTEPKGKALCLLVDLRSYPHLLSPLCDKIYCDLLRFAEFCWGLLGFAGVSWGLLRSAGVCHDLKGSAVVFRGLQGFAGVLLRYEEV